MTILRKIIKDKKREQKKYRNKDLTLAILLGATAGVLSGIAVNSKSDKISKTFKKIKDKTTKSMEIGKDKVEDAKNALDDKIDKKKNEIKDKAEEATKEIKKELKKD